MVESLLGFVYDPAYHRLLGQAGEFGLHASLHANADLAAQYDPLLTSTMYDPGLRQPLTKRGLLSGMSMTEKQVGSDLTDKAEAGDQETRPRLKFARARSVRS